MRNEGHSLGSVRRLHFGLWFLCVAAFSLLVYDRAGANSGDVTSCTEPEILSRWSGFNAVDPLLISDFAGRVHLFWAQRTLGSADTMGPPDSLMYSVWNGSAWSTPNDLFISPPDHVNRNVTGIRGGLDEKGRIHLVWMGPDGLAYYSSAPADSAISARSWQQPVVLAYDQSGMQYSVGIAVEPAESIHVAYVRSQESASQTLMYTRSTDGGVNWSEPLEVFRSQQLDRGTSNVRLYTPGAGAVYMTWTEWDSSGTGQVIYFARSRDGGVSWDIPVALDKREGDEYERDWVNLTVLDDGRLMVLWEGGFRAYPQAQYSDDLGATWSAPIDTFPWLIADNGYAEFVRDGDGRLHTFLIRRVREGNSEICDSLNCTHDGNAIWHSTWLGQANWTPPQKVGPFSDANYLAAAQSLGNQLHLAWFSYNGLELWTMRCAFDETRALAPVQQSAATLSIPNLLPTSTPHPAATEPSPAIVPNAAGVHTTQATLDQDVEVAGTYTGRVLISALLPVATLLAIAGAGVIARHRTG